MSEKMIKESRLGYLRYLACSIFFANFDAAQFFFANRFIMQYRTAIRNSMQSLGKFYRGHGWWARKDA